VLDRATEFQLHLAETQHPRVENRDEAVIYLTELPQSIREKRPHQS
jgi:hypothetical protein